MSERSKRAKLIKTNASKKLRTNLRILAVVYLVLLVVTLYNLVISQAIFWQVLVAIVIGVIAGFISARMYKISWNHDEAEVIGKIDIYGAIVLAAFILFEVNRTRIASLFASGDSIGSITLVLVTSALLGRLLGTSRRIIHVIQEERII